MLLAVLATGCVYLMDIGKNPRDPWGEAGPKRMRPVVGITAPIQGQQIASGETTLMGQVAASAGVSRVVIQVNGRAVGNPLDDHFSGENVALSENIPLDPGVNVIRVSAYDSEGRVSRNTVTVTRVDGVAPAPPLLGAVAQPGLPRPAPPRRYKPTYERRVAVAIGINE